MHDEPALRLRIHLQPRAKGNRVLQRHGDVIKVQVQAPPSDGAANTALVALLASTLAVPRHSIRILHGARGRQKLIEVRCADPTACRRRLDAAMTASR
jgi:uncharacterized protein (TIGR00251 family)